MGKASTVANITTGMVFSLSTISINKVQNLPGRDGDGTPVLYQTAIYRGRTKPLATSLGKKPLVVVSKGNTGLQGRPTIDEYHKYLCDVFENVQIDDVTDLEAFLESDHANVRSVWYGKAPQIMYGFRTVEFLTIF